MQENEMGRKFVGVRLRQENDEVSEGQCVVAAESLAVCLQGVNWQVKYRLTQFHKKQNLSITAYFPDPARNLPAGHETLLLQLHLASRSTTAYFPDPKRRLPEGHETPLLRLDPASR